MSRVIVTGINGFVGQHMVRELKEVGCQVVGVAQENKPAPQIAELIDEYRSGDLSDTSFMNSLSLEGLAAVINLAGIARMSDPNVSNQRYTEVNAEVIRSFAKRLEAGGHKTTRLLAISSGQVYDNSKTPPFNESSALIAPPNRNPYVFSKLLMEDIVQEYLEKDLDIVIARPFNHIGPGQQPGFLLPDLALQLHESKQAHKSTIEVGDLTKKRDFSDVRDVVRAYRLLAFADRANFAQTTYNVCSGISLTGRHILDLLMPALGASEMSVTIDQSRLRPNDPPVLYGDYSAIKRDVGWQPTIAIEKTVADFAEWYKSSS